MKSRPAPAIAGGFPSRTIHGSRPRALRRFTYGSLGSLELAKDDFVFTHEDRAEVTDVESGPREVGDAFTRPPVERVEIGCEHARPEALRDEARVRCLDHASTVRAGVIVRKAGLPYERDS